MKVALNTITDNQFLWKYVIFLFSWSKSVYVIYCLRGGGYDLINIFYPATYVYISNWIFYYKIYLLKSNNNKKRLANNACDRSSVFFYTNYHYKKLLTCLWIHKRANWRLMFMSIKCYNMFSLHVNYTILIFDFWIVPTVWHNSFFIILWCLSIASFDDCFESSF